MKHFMDKNFLLKTKTARYLYHAVAKREPIWDYHCHLSPKEIAENARFETLTDIWLAADHYKWRQMRTFGIEEALITGDAAPYDKFYAWAHTVEHLIGNPLYHWTHLELQRYFNIYEPLTRKSAPRIWEKANEMLKDERLCVKGILRSFNVYAVGTTDDPVDSLEWHKTIADKSAPIGEITTKVCPSFRPDKALYIESPDFAPYIARLGEVSGTAISSPSDVVLALGARLDYFIAHGCRASDHALEYPPYTECDFGNSGAQSGGDSTQTGAVSASTQGGAGSLNGVSAQSANGSAPNAPYTARKEAEKERAFGAFEKAMQQKPLTQTEVDSYKAYVLCRLARLYREKNIAMQLHFSVIRNNNPVAMRALGPDTGFDASCDHELSVNLSRLLARIEDDGGLPKTILYTLNPKDYYAIATLIGCFQGGGIKGKVQLGSAWWFCDHRDGMSEHLKTLSALSMLSPFIGMLTDSRSFLSYPRHEYFRRILCNTVGTWVENGEYPNEKATLSSIIQGISFGNIEAYLR